MNRSLTARIMDLLQRRQMKGALAKAALGLSCIAIFLITYMLVAPVLTQEWEATCGLEEHTHTDACYGEVSGEIVCGLEAHTHSDECLDEDGNLSCGLEEHIHTEECCQAAEETGHKHTDACYTVVPAETAQAGHKHTDACYTLVPAETEDSGHTHTDACYEEVRGELICGLEEHSHSDGCLDEEGNQICELSEHTHDDSCYAYEKELICGLEETEAQEPEMIPTLTCGLEETEEQPPETDTVLTCGLEETEVQEPEKVRVLICGLAEHTHTDQCYQKAEESAPKYTCGFLTEHTHGEDCYFENGELKCTIPEHVHEESCLEESGESEQRGETDWSGFPEELPEGYVEAEVFQSDGAMYAMTDGEETGAEEITARVYIPQDAFEENVMFVPQPLFEEDEAYTAAAEDLREAGAEYESLTAMDLSFVGIDSYETLEPNTANGPIYVRLAMPAEELLEDAELTLWHHTEDGAEKVENCSYKYADGTLTVDFMTDSFSIYTLTTSAAPEEGDNSSPVSWGTTVPSVTSAVENGVTTWDVFDVNYRYVDIPVNINVSGLDQDMTVTLPLVLDIAEAGRNGYKPRYKNTGETGDGWTITADENSVTVTIKSFSTGHKSIDVYYRFDCWQVVSGKQFTVDYTVANGSAAGQGASQGGTLSGCVQTGNGGTIIPYATEWDESIYSFNGFGGADKKGAYILGWSEVYKTYFGLEQGSFDTDNYIYDIAAYEVQPTGQQPYSISGTITPDQHGEVIGGVYMMDSAGDQDAESALCVTIPASEPTVVDGNNQYSFTIEETSLNKVVSSLEDETDHKTYTLYFLVKYPRVSLTGYEEIKDWADNVIDHKVSLNAALELTHTGIDSGTPTQIEGETSFCCYDGASKVDIRTYWATYYSTAVNSSAGLTMLKNGNTATVEYSADFFSLNEARPGSTSTMVAIIDLSYVTNDGKKQQLGTDDYRISGFNLSLIDAPGSWSQNTTNTPNVGWTADKYGTAPAGTTGTIKVYGSTSLTGDSWTEVASVSAASVWALNQDRAFRGNSTPITGDYVRLKVEYDSHYTTALRVGYQMELKPDIVSKYSLQNAETLNLTNWFNYGAYKTNTISAESADTDNFVFQRYPVDDSTPAWTNYDGTIKEVREYDNKSGPTSGLPGYNLKTESWDEGYSLRGFARTALNSSNDVAGMMVTQALYDSDGNLVGNPTSIDPNTKDSYSLKTEVANVSEIVYNISGAVTSGASSLDDLKERINAAGADSPYKSLAMRYYVLLPAGLKLNINPDNGEKDENGAPKYHFWTEGTTEYLSANSAFYNGNSSKVVQGGQTDVPVSDANIPGWKRLSSNGWLSEMFWEAAGAVTHDTANSSGQLYVFERTLSGYAWDQFNLWGASTFFWGRGLSFSVVPEKGTGSLPAGTYTPQFWCQFLDGNGNPISLDGFAKETVTDNPLNQDNDTLLYIPSTFINKHHIGDSDGEIAVVIAEDSIVTLEDGVTEAVKPEGNYSYPLTYKVTTGSSTDVVLWCNVEEMSRFGLKSEWQGTVTGVNLGNETGVKVYVRAETFTASDYKDKADKSWLTTDNGWTEVTGLTDWSKVKAIAFYFEGKTFTAGSTATVSINMKAPADDTLTIDGQPKGPDRTVYTAYNELLISDSHVEDTGTSGSKTACYFANYVEVPMKVTPVSYVLPSTGGAGTTITYTTGLGLILGAAYLMYQNLRRGRETGVPEAAPEDKRGGSRLR